MPFIKLNSSKINYNYSIGSDNFIVSQIVDSACSTCSPTIIRDKQSLDIFFGKNFKERDYLDELLDSGVSLLLYKPISSEKTKDGGDYIVIPKEEKRFLSADEFPQPGSPDYLYVDTYTSKKFIWDVDGEFYININDLPQNLLLEENYEEWYNRDTLRLSTPIVFFRVTSSGRVLPNKPVLTESRVNISNESLDPKGMSIINSLGRNLILYKSIDDDLENNKLSVSGNSSIVFSLNNFSDLYCDEGLVISIILDSGEKVSGIYWEANESIKTPINAIFQNIELGKIHEIEVLDSYSFKEKTNPILYCHPRYKKEDPIDYFGDNLQLHLCQNESYDYLTMIENGERGLALDLKFSDSIDFYKEGNEAGYLCFSIPGNSDTERFLIWFNRGDDLVPIGSDYINSGKAIKIDLFRDNEERKSREEIIYEVLDCLDKEKSSTRPFNIISKVELKEYILWSSSGTFTDGFFTNFNDEEVMVSLNLSITNDFLRQESEETKRIEFFSKTIGPNDEDIKVKIEPINYFLDKYRITISRFNYSETYDVNLYDTPDRLGHIESLDSIINRSSRLVECKLYREKPDGTYWVIGEKAGKLPIGEWSLKRAFNKEKTPEMYWEALNRLREYNAKEDFILIPEIEYFLKHEDNYEDLGYFPEYLEILEYCRYKNCQALIGNLDFGYSESFPKDEDDIRNRVIYKIGEDKYKISWNGKLNEVNLNKNTKILYWGNTFIYNYSSDQENRLVYFYRSMILYGVHRPAYYLFLKGILSGRYSEVESDLIYLSPTKNSFVEEPIEKILEGKKCNYLVTNNQEYFYKTYQNHPGDGLYDTTILTRWSMSKISKALENNKWTFLGKQSIGEIKSGITTILNSLVGTYSIYRNILLDSVSTNFQEKTMNVYVKAYLRELVDKPIYLDVIINYY